MLFLLQSSLESNVFCEHLIFSVSYKEELVCKKSTHGTDHVYVMFELSDELDITVVSDIGIDKKSAFIIDNFYKDPDAVRFISIRGQSGGMSGGMPGNRVCFPTNEIRNIKKISNEQLPPRPAWWKRSFWTHFGWY